MNANTRSILLAAALLWPLLTGAGESTLNIGHFSAGDLTGWDSKVFKGETSYTLEKAPELPGTPMVLRAESKAAASGRFREMTIDLQKTPYVNWSWKTEKVFEGLDETTKAGDDFPVRVYFVVSGGLFFWRTIALNYVWSASHKAGESWPNPFTSNATMLAVESGPEHVGIWRQYKRNLREDFRKLTGRDITRIDAVALMTDTDNAGGETTAWYGDIYFTAE